MVYAPSLTGLGDRSHLLSGSVDLATHARDIASLIEFEDLSEVILVGHSYGGMVITGAADLIAERVGKLVFLDAATPKNHQSLVDVAGPFIEAVRPFGEVVDGVELVLLPAPGAGAFFGVTDPDVAAWMDARLTAHPWACFEQKLELTNEADLWSIPQFHVICSSTSSTRDATMMRDAEAEGRLFQIDTGHDLMLTEPGWVADAFATIAARR